MIELFSRSPIDFELKFETGLTPIHIDESILSLSAILLNDAYYDLLLKGNKTVDEYYIIEIETVILFKIKAWLEMKKRRENGEHVDSKNIKKHKNDVFRLLSNVTPSVKINTGREVKNDVNKFIELIEEDKPDIKNLGIKGTDYYELIEILKNIYLKK